MPSTVLPAPTPDELDDLIYFCRTGDLDSLQPLITELCKTHICAPSVLLASAIDIDADGLGSQSCLLHYPAANGNVEVVKYILGLIRPDIPPTEDTKTSSLAEDSSQTNSVSALSDKAVSGIGVAVVDKAAPSLVNHRNVSGNTPLHWAGMNGHLEVVKLLVQYGADPSAVNAAGRDAVVESEMSAAEGAQECAEWMLQNCAGLETAVGGSSEGVVEGEPADEVGDDTEQAGASTNPTETTTNGKQTDTGP